MKAKIGKVDHALPCYNQSRHQLFRKFTLNKDYVIYSPCEQTEPIQVKKKSVRITCVLGPVYMEWATPV